jgi:hypothetical protein
MTYRNNIVSLFALIVLLIVLLLFAVVCEPIIRIEVENRTEQALIIYNRDIKIGEVEPGKVAEMAPGSYIAAHILAVNSEGKLVYSKEFTRLELAKIGDRIVISPSSEGYRQPK